MSFRREMVILANRTNANIREIGRRYKVSPKTIYKWLKRYAKDGEEGLRDISRRPHQSPKRCSKNVEAKVLKIRDAHPAWGARKIGVRLKTIGEIAVPVDSTIHEIRVVMSASIQKNRPSTRPGSDLSMQLPISSGRWISKAGLRLGTGCNVIP